MLNPKLKEKLLQITDMYEIGIFLKENNISLLIEDEEIQKHLEKYYCDPDDGIIRDIRKK